MAPVCVRASVGGAMENTTYGESSHASPRRMGSLEKAEEVQTWMALDERSFRRRWHRVATMRAQKERGSRVASLASPVWYLLLATCVPFSAIQHKFTRALSRPLTTPHCPATGAITYCEAAVDTRVTAHAPPPLPAHGFCFARCPPTVSQCAALVPVTASCTPRGGPRPLLTHTTSKQ